jgi:serine protease Do
MRSATLLLSTSALAAGLVLLAVHPFTEAAPVRVARTADATPAGLPDFSPLVEKAGPAVVNIRTTEKVAAKPSGSDEEEMRELFRRFFGDQLPPEHPPVAPKAPKGGNKPQAEAGPESAPDPAPGPSAEPQRERVQRGVGSGFIVSNDGYVLTNAHVVDGADEVFVKLNDRREFTATVVGTDTRTDVAVLKIAATDLPTITLGASSTTKVGEWVIGIGSPFDLDNSVTAGIVSAKARETGDFLPLIQTDVPINPGNSGGPLINMRGEVVGINSQIYSRSGGFMGISFAIPIEDALRVADELRHGGHVTRGRMGVYLSDVDRDVATSLGLPKSGGGLVGRIERGGPAEQAGLRDGDIVVAFDGKPVERSAELRRLAAATRPGTRVDLTVWRNGASRPVALTLAELEPPKVAARPDAKAAPAAPVAPDSAAWGLTVAGLTPSQKAELGTRPGVVIDKAEGASRTAGLRPGDIVLALNNVDVDSPQAFSTLAGQAAGKPAVALVRRGNTSQYVMLRSALR